MNWIEEVNWRLGKKNQVLFAKDSEYLQDLTLLFENQNHRVMVLWAFDLAEESVQRLKAKYPDEKRPGEALAAAQDWASGRIKMRLARRKILDCHTFAKEISNKEDIAACHAVGQACAVVHTAGHAIGYPMYDLTSIVYRLGIGNCAQAVESRKQEYIEKLIYWSSCPNNHMGRWAKFMLRYRQNS